MKKHTKPEVDKVTIDVKFILMLTPSGFRDVFWDELAKKRKENPGITQKEVFDLLNEEYYRVFGVYRYSDYDSFRRRMNRLNNNKLVNNLY